MKPGIHCVRTHWIPGFMAFFVGGAGQPAALRCWGGRLILAENRSRRLTTPRTRRPSMIGRCRKPFRSMIWAPSSTGVSGPADWGSLVIQADTGTAVRSEPDAAALSTSRSVRMPARKVPCMTRAEPTFSRTIAAAASATGLSGLVDTMRECIRSPTVKVRRVVSATFADFEKFRLVMRRRRPSEFLGQQPPQRARPLGQLRPPHPEQLEGRLVKLSVRLLRGHGVGEILELVHEVEEPVSASIHSITSRGSRGADHYRWPGRRQATLSGVIYTPKGPFERGRPLPIFPRRGRKV